MQPSTFDFFRALLDAPGPSGSEGPVQKIFAEYVRDCADEIRWTPHGSVAAIRNPQGTPRVVVTGHADEIGLIVHHVDDDGFVFFRGIGGVDSTTLPGSRVEIHTAGGVVDGVLGRKPTHLQSNDERGKIGKVSKLYIDIGCASKDDALEKVRPGDPITFRRGITRLGDDLIASKSTDNRAGVFCAAEAFRRLGSEAPEACVIALSTVCEELGGEGALTAAYDLEPDLALVVDVTFASDQPDVSTSDVAEIGLAKGPVVARGPRLNESLVGLVEAAAKKASIDLQYEVLENRTGTDGDLFYRSRRGVPIGLVSVPCRYMHTPSEVVSLSDLDSIATLLATVVGELGGDVSLRPFA